MRRAPYARDAPGPATLIRIYSTFLVIPVDVRLPHPRLVPLMTGSSAPCRCPTPHVPRHIYSSTDFAGSIALLARESGDAACADADRILHSSQSSAYWMRTGAVYGELCAFAHIPCLPFTFELTQSSAIRGSFIGLYGLRRPYPPPFNCSVSPCSHVASVYFLSPLDSRTRTRNHRPMPSVSTPTSARRVVPGRIWTRKHLLLCLYQQSGLFEPKRKMAHVVPSDDDSG
jgi:hypothetical protein